MIPPVKTFWFLFSPGRPGRGLDFVDFLSFSRMGGGVFDTQTKN